MEFHLREVDAGGLANDEIRSLQNTHTRRTPQLRVSGHGRPVYYSNVVRNEREDVELRHTTSRGQQIEQ